MIYAVIALCVVNLVLLIVLLLRRATQPEAVVDPRLAQLLAADLPTQMTRLDARSETLDGHLRDQLAQLRKDAGDDAGRARVAAEGSSTALRKEVQESIQGLGGTLRTGLDGLRGDNKGDAERLRTTVEARLDKLSELNAAKLEEMRVTVDEKLQTTLQDRLTKSFGQVTDQLTKVHAGLGEMTKLSAGVDDLSRIFTNVKSRGGIGELALEMLLKDRLAPSQYVHNAKVKPNSQEVVEFAVRFPTPNGEMLLPIDSKFPREVFERLEAAYESGDEVVSAGRAFEAAIRFEGKKICDKYVAPPHTTPFAIMFLPTEGLYAEVIRRDGLLADIQQSCQVTIAGPSTLSAILTSFQMGFHMLQMQEKGDEVWKVLASARTQFGKFEDLMTKMDDQVSKVQKTIQDVGTRTRAINRTLKDVTVEAAVEGGGKLAGGGANSFDGLLPMLAAGEEEALD